MIFDAVKDAANRAQHGLPLAFGERLPSIREVDGEERFKVVGTVAAKQFTAVFVWRDGTPVSYR